MTRRAAKPTKPEREHCIGVDEDANGVEHYTVWMTCEGRPNTDCGNLVHRYVRETKRVWVWRRPR